ncbi:hypothetical protein RIK65_12995 [Enterobacter asburiae]|uniref:hypothetical protein n=1 Tax=Enterobacter asburiae TaxID=61645 RepID=UPI00288C623E|nr:hypothetical protein [Enterobacter asburiae]WNI61738.1 hypothetical protein RIL73_14685 [Enterobacter asburiae]WNI65864.1 hypothetical protein RIK65_12995 [Enterobacter asburiae]
MSKYIFSNIHLAAAAHDPNYESDDKIRWIEGKDADDLNLMSEADVKVLSLSARTFTVSITNGEDKYFCFCGLTLPPALPTNLEEIDATPGLFACVVFCSKLESNATSSQARDILEQQYLHQDGYNGHDLSAIMNLYPSLYFLKEKDKNSTPYLNNLERVTGAFITSGYTTHPLAINEIVIARLLTLFEAGEETIPFKLPLQGILSYNWPTLFLELYRCLEQLYTVLKLKSLVQKMPYTGALAELAYLFEEELAWRPKEQDALASILAYATDLSRSNILSAFGVDTSTMSEFSSSKCASFVYKLRNSQVHFRPAMKSTELPITQWNSIVLAMCDIVDEVYKALGSDFLNSKTHLAPAVENQEI